MRVQKEWTGRVVSTTLVLLLAFLNPAPALATSCPGPGSTLTQVWFVVDTFISEQREPAGADCAYSWAMGVDLTTAPLDGEQLKFFQVATHVQRLAAQKRLSANRVSEGRQYLQQEVDIRQALVDEVTSRVDSGNGANALRPLVIQNLSYLASALALRREYQEVTNVLGDQEPVYVDNEALKVWLQALWSCANWDGNKRNICTPSNRDVCREKIAVFLESFDGMGARKLPPQARVDINGLRSLTKAGGCLQ